MTQKLPKFRTVWKVIFGLAVLLVVLLAAVLSWPLHDWRTGRGQIEQLRLAPAGEYAIAARRVWIDTDAACGAGSRTDPDDCLALLALIKAPKIRVAGISTVYGNASIEVTDRTTRELVALLAAEGHAAPSVFRGLGSALDKGAAAAPTPAEVALRDALKQGPMTIVALGPLSNLAAVLRRDPALAAQVEAVVSVMGQRPGHVFHPVEGGATRMLFGHGPVFSDFNFAKDRLAAAELLALPIRMTLVPYEAAQALILTEADLDAMGRAGSASRWVADRSRAWLSFWQADIRQDGFFSFDLAAAAYLLHPQLFRCARVRYTIARHSWYWRWVLGDTGLFVQQALDRPPGVTEKPGDGAVYCPSAVPGVHEAALADLIRPSSPR